MLKRDMRAEVSLFVMTFAAASRAYPDYYEKIQNLTSA